MEPTANDHLPTETNGRNGIKKKNETGAFPKYGKEIKHKKNPVDNGVFVIIIIHTIT